MAGATAPAASEALRALAAPFEAAGRAWSVVRRDGTAIGVLGFDDEIAPGVPEAVRALAEDGIAVVMVTGDHERAARRIADRAGIREVWSRQTPAGKLAVLRRYHDAGGFVAYVGDGINDAPALAAADMGIAIGSGTDVARESSGVVLVRSDFRSVALALRLGRRTVRKVRGNLTWAIGYNAVLLPVAVGALVPWLGLGIYSVLPIVGAVAMGLSSTSVVLNSLSLRWVSLGGDGRRRRVAAPA
ncbi:ATPase, P-type, K/Mg/Cd/Cu/Zn/Na/Ca/Na/H-transporter [mine drainage metagenome]|uniref:ATPase, P-type, K/Mg/Cd/Cu/Zn/Na/Ca/Na/H-transporter n=1 Tax=mine drainage metagenome TaxID=410659 RepID=T0Z1L5_9ZZZZ